MGPYWDQKRVDMTKIQVPTFLSGSDVSSLHTMGTIRAWLEIPHKNKWLKWSGYQEWFDLWAEPHNMDDLKGFFDKFLKEKDNDWAEKTPKVRMAALQFGDKDPIEDIVVEDWPLPNTQYTDMYLSGDGKLSSSKPEKETSMSYDSTTAEAAVLFKHIFDKRSRIMGLPKAHLYMSTKDHDDMCVFILLQKLDKDGNLLKHVQVPISRRWVKKYADIEPKDHTGTLMHPGSLGVLRASHRAIDRSKTMHPQFPFHPHDKTEKIPAGEVVELEIGIWHMGVDYEEGETLQVSISGCNPAYPELKSFGGYRTEDSDRNRGQHELHFGGKYDSRVIIPFVPL